MKQVRRSCVHFLVFLVGFTLAGCGSSPAADHNDSKQAQTSQQPGNQADPSQPSAPTPAVPSATPTESAPNLTYFSIIREFGGKDTGALFGVLPDRGTLQVTKVGESGADFLDVGYRIVTINSANVDKLFSNSSIPMSQQEKNGIVAKYSGAQAIYFEGYNGQLCTDNEVKVVAFSTFGDLNLITTFDFAALPNSSGDCTFHILTTLTESGGN